MLNNLEQIETEIGKVLVIVNEVIENGELRYDGRIFDENMKIFIQTPTKESCLEGLKNAFELQIHFWLYKELLPMNIEFPNE
jgi:hypothetical protein